MADYTMLADGDRILVAVSGGIDSLVLIRVLQLWKIKAPISYTFHGIHVDMQPEKGRPGEVARNIQASLQRCSIPCHVLPATWFPDKNAIKDGRVQDICFRCARSRRTRLFAYAREHGYTLLALGHHRDDIIETFFLNMLHAGNLSTMAPKQKLFSGRLSLIRPLAYLSKKEVEQLGRDLLLQPIRAKCPLSENTSRSRVHELVEAIEERLPGARDNIFTALGNVRPDYLLDPSFRNDHAHRS